MSYKSTDLWISTGHAELRHSCDEWVIGKAPDVKKLIADLEVILGLLESGNTGWIHPTLKAEQDVRQKEWERRHKEAGPEWHAAHPNENPPSR